MELPPELIAEILSFCDDGTALIACHVCKSWLDGVRWTGKTILRERGLLAMLTVRQISALDWALACGYRVPVAMAEKHVLFPQDLELFLVLDRHTTPDVKFETFCLAKLKAWDKTDIAQQMTERGWTNTPLQYVRAMIERKAALVLETRVMSEYRQKIREYYRYMLAEPLMKELLREEPGYATGTIKSLEHSIEAVGLPEEDRLERIDILLQMRALVASAQS